MIESSDVYKYRRDEGIYITKMKKNTTLWIMIKYPLILVFVYTFLDLIFGEIELSEVPLYLLNRIINLFVFIFIFYILIYIVSIVGRLFRL
ncbi:hypothetical protein DFQ12_2945 [Sphingobacterium detergens]|uniref:Uncharacterized protein n=1 Tax=Sphingobacterium detergens TaxID=1145106 RepID=A0A420B7P9_SPHD1|nr:hypothetical protein DFQ12_2945 [Sphingobacterium detergens]